MDVWQYAKLENIELPSLYFAHKREVIDRNGSILAVTDFVTPSENEAIRQETVRFRTIGDATCTGAVVSNAKDLDDVIGEVSASRMTERGARADDKRSEAAMEDRKSKDISKSMNTEKDYINMDMLRFTTAGSVDDGKSTLIGRLFHDTKSIFEDQLEAIEQSSRNRGDENINLALLTDGLRAEENRALP